MIASCVRAGRGRRHDEDAEEVRGVGALLARSAPTRSGSESAPAPSARSVGVSWRTSGLLPMRLYQKYCSARRYAIVLAGADQARRPGRRAAIVGGRQRPLCAGSARKRRSSRATVVCQRVHVDGEQREHDARRRRAASASERGAMPAEALPHAAASRREPAVPALVAGEQDDEQHAEQEQRPRLRRGDRRGVPLRRMREDARVDERACRRRAPRRGAGRAARRRAARCGPGCARVRSCSASCSSSAWSAFESSRSLTRRIAPCFTCARFSASARHLEARSPTRVPPMKVSHGVWPKTGVLP